MIIKIITNSILKSQLVEMARSQFGDFVKAVVDVRREIMAIGGELHADEEAMLLADGSQQENLWGVNIFPEKSGEERVMFNSMINIRPSQGNKSRGVENPAVQEKIKQVVNKLFANDP